MYRGTRKSEWRSDLFSQYVEPKTDKKPLTHKVAWSSATKRYNICVPIDVILVLSSHPGQASHRGSVSRPGTVIVAFGLTALHGFCEFVFLHLRLLPQVFAVLELRNIGEVSPCQLDSSPCRWLVYTTTFPSIVRDMAFLAPDSSGPQAGPSTPSVLRSSRPSSPAFSDVSNHDGAPSFAPSAGHAAALTEYLQVRWICLDGCVCSPGRKRPAVPKKTLRITTPGVAM